MKAAVRTRPRASTGKARWRGRDTHERQAEASSAAFVRGQRRLGHILTAAPVAGYRVPGSVATVLPRPIAGELAVAFDVDFRGLRIHRDAPAQAAAKALGARAFTSGAAIYFAEHAWDPGSVRGRRLIAHEAAHAIQQTGRVAHRGLRLEPGAVGTAGVQRDPDVAAAIQAARDSLTKNQASDRLFAQYQLLYPKTGVDACMTVIERHLALPVSAAVAEQAGRLRTALTGAKDSDAASIIDGVLKDNGGKKVGDRVIALFYDCLKAAGAGAQAIQLAGKNLPRQTAFGSWTFFEKNLRDTGGWVVPLLQKNKTIAPYVFGTLVRVMVLDFVSVGRGTLDLDPSGRFEQTMRNAIEQALLYQPLMADERTVSALRALMRFDAVRRAPMVQFAAKLGSDKRFAARMALKRAMIESFLNPDYLAKIAKDAGMELEVVEIAKAAGPKISSEAATVKKVWAQVDELESAIRNPDKTKLDSQLRSMKLAEMVADRLPSVKPLAGVQAKLIDTLAVATRSEAGGLPSASTLVANAAAAAEQLRNLTFEIDRIVADQAASGTKSSSKVDAVPNAQDADAVLVEAATYGLVLSLVNGLHDALIAINPGKPASSKTDPRDWAAVELRDIARRFGKLGRTLGYSNLVKASGVAWAVQQPKWTRSYIALPNDFEIMPSSLGDFHAEFPRGGTFGRGLSGTGILAAILALYDESLLDNLKAALDRKIGLLRREQVYDPNLDPILKDAVGWTASAIALPLRYRFPEAIFYLSKSDEQNIAGVLGQEKHPAFERFLTESVSRQAAWFVGQEVSVHKGGLVVWVIPRLDLIANKLATFPFIASLKRKDDSPLGLPGADPGEAYDWLESLGEIAKSQAGLEKQIADAVQQWQWRARRALDASYRRATNNVRRTIGLLVEAEWRRYTVRSTDAHHDAPKNAFAYTNRFVNSVMPSTDSERKLQSAALMLEVAPVLLDELEHTDQLQIIFPLYKLIVPAVKEARNAEAAATIATLDLSFKANEIAQRAKMLEELAANFKQLAYEQRADRKLSGDPREKRLFVPGRPYGLKAKSGDEDARDMVSDPNNFRNGRPLVYQLLEVYRTFTFQPPLMIKGADTPDIGQAKFDIPGLKPGEGPVKLLRIMVVVSEGDAREVDVTSADAPLLRDLFYALDYSITMEMLQDVADILEVVADVLITVIQVLFPEFAPEIAYAQLASSIFQFFAGPDYALVKSLLGGGLSSAFSKGLDALEEELSPEFFWNFLLFQDADLPPNVDRLRKLLNAGLSVTQDRMSSVRPKHGNTSEAITKVFAGIAGFAVALLNGVESVHRHVAPPARQAELFIAGSPLVAALLRFVVRHLGQVETLSLQEVGASVADNLPGEVGKMFHDIEGMIAELVAFELPRELVPLEVIIEMVVNFIIDRLPPKYRYVLRGIKHIKHVEKLFRWIYGKVADKFRDHHIDPNELWQTLVTDKLNPIIQEQGDAFAGGVMELLRDIPFLKGLDIAAAKSQKDPFAKDPQPKAAGGRSTPTGFAALPMGGGIALRPEERARAQRGMGHDFGHVRVHRGIAIDNALRGADALAATAGSHVYLDSLIDPGNSGRDTLNHELAHVLQQTGARPLGESHPDRPVDAAAGGGAANWRVDSAAEAQADHLAQAARAPAAAPRPVTPHQGVQPRKKLVDVATSFLGKAADIEQLHATAAHLGGGKVDQAKINEAAPGLPNRLKSALAAFDSSGRPNDRIKVNEPFKAAQEAIFTYLNTKGEEINRGMDAAVTSAIEPVKIKGDDNKKKIVQKLNPTLLETRLKELLFGTTGYSVDVNVKLLPAKKSEDRTINPEDPITLVRIKYVHFRFIGSTSDLWKNIVPDTFGSTNSKLAKYRTAARQVLQEEDASPGLFRELKGKLVFGTKLMKKIENALDRSVLAGDLPPESVPKWKDYINPDLKTGTKDKDYGHIGLRHGVHKELSGAGTDRESHHTVQFLLLEYLNNIKGSKPFPVKDTKLYQNVEFEGSSKKVKTIRSQPVGGDEISIGPNMKNRAGTMPALLLSIRAHDADIHITPKKDDDEKSTPSQSTAVDSIFRKALGDYEDTVADEEQLRKIRDQNLSKRTDRSLGGMTSEKLSLAIFKAASATYSEMRKAMNPKLEVALEKVERKYYDDLVRAANKTAQPEYRSSNISASVMIAVKRNQTDVLEGKGRGFGFKATGGAK